MEYAPVGGINDVALEEGSKILLNTNSAMRPYRSGTSNGVELLQGEAVVDVMENTQQPFVFRVGELEAQSKGGKIHARIDGDAVTVNALTGDAWIRSGHPPRGSSVLLPAGKSAVWRFGRLTVNRFDAADVNRKLAWIQGEIAFFNEPLDRAVEEFNRYNTLKMVVTDDGLAGFKIGGRFQANDVAGFIASLAKLGVVAIGGENGIGVVMLVKRRKVRVHGERPIRIAQKSTACNAKVSDLRTRCSTRHLPHRRVAQC